MLGAHAPQLVIAVWWLGPVMSTPAPEPAIVVDMVPVSAPPEPLSEQPPGRRGAGAPAAESGDPHSAHQHCQLHAT